MQLVKHANTFHVPLFCQAKAMGPCPGETMMLCAQTHLHTTPTRAPNTKFKDFSHSRRALTSRIIANSLAFCCAKSEKKNCYRKKQIMVLLILKKSFVASIFQIINRLPNAHELVTRRTCIRNHRDHTSLRRMSTMGPISRLKVLRSMDINWHRLETFI